MRGEVGRQLRRAYWGPVVEVVDRLEYVRSGALCDVAKQVAHRLFGIRADVVHVFLNGIETIIVHD